MTHVFEAVKAGAYVCQRTVNGLIQCYGVPVHRAILSKGLKHALYNCSRITHPLGTRLGHVLHYRWLYPHIAGDRGRNGTVAIDKWSQYSVRLKYLNTHVKPSLPSPAHFPNTVHGEGN